MPEDFGPVNNIVLSDYNYQRDIENRLLMAELTVFEVDVLREILDSSLKISLKQLSKSLDVTEKEMLPVLNKLSITKLIHRQGDNISVDKEMRRYYESQILKFDEEFEPGMEFLQGLLSKVPIHALPNWYSIPRMTNNIFASIVENYLRTPKIYERYLSSLRFEDPVMNGIIRDVLTSADFKVLARDLIKKYGLTREAFEVYMLQLEYNFVCCLGYNRVRDRWVEVVTPFYEWRSYLRMLRDSLPKKIDGTSAIQRTYPHDFGFVQDCAQILTAAQQEIIKLQRGSISLKEAIYILPHLKEIEAPGQYLKSLIDTLVSVPVAAIKESQLRALPQAKEWLSKSLQEQALALYRNLLAQLRQTTLSNSKYTERDVRETERSLRRVANSGWIYFDDFMAGMIASVGSAESVTLQNKGKRWKYVLPTYTPEDQAFIKQVVFDLLTKTGMVATGSHRGRPCFCVTPFGRMSIGE